MKEIALVSSCMLGIPCKYNGEAASQRLDEDTIQRLNLTVIPVCPEQLGGLPTPRINAEILGGDGQDVLNGKARVVTSDGQDVTAQFVRGAKQVLHIAQMTGATMAIVKKRSPSCSNCSIYNGTFSRKVRDGVGVTVALLMAKTNLSIYNLDEINEKAKGLSAPAALQMREPAGEVRDKVRPILMQMLLVYQSQKNWNDRQQESIHILGQLNNMGFSRGDLDAALRAEFVSLLPKITGAVSDSDTVRFYREAINRVMGIDILATDRHCRICTYPEGFLDTYLNEDGICSACVSYQQNKSTLEDYDHLRSVLQKAIDEARGQSQYDAAIAFSGGKDSVYLLTRLAKYYNARVLCVMDDLNQQTEQAMRNARRAAADTGGDLLIVDPPPMERDIRRNFLNNGESFCRLCLRSHFARVYEVAVQKRIPFVFFGLSPYQFLDCPNAIEWSINAIKDVSMPSTQRNASDIVQRYQHRTFQGGFDRGFIQPNEKQLLQNWMDVFEKARDEFVPLMIPFFLFDSYPGDMKVMEVIAREVGWEKPETLLLRRTNCRWLRPAGIMHRAVFKYHLNYKERAAELRFRGKVMSEDDARQMFLELNRPNQDEAMTIDEFNDFLLQDFSMTMADLPVTTQMRVKNICNGEAHG